MAQVSVSPTQNAFYATATAETLTDGFPDLESNWGQDLGTLRMRIMSVKAEILSDDSALDIEKGVVQNVISHFVTATARAILIPFMRSFADDFTKSKSIL